MAAEPEGAAGPLTRAGLTRTASRSVSPGADTGGFVRNAVSAALTRSATVRCAVVSIHPEHHGPLRPARRDHRFLSVLHPAGHDRGRGRDQFLHRTTGGYPVKVPLGVSRARDSPDGAALARLGRTRVGDAVLRDSSGRHIPC